MTVLLRQSGDWIDVSEFRNNNALTDCEFVVDDGRISCHLLVLLGSSGLLGRIFVEQPASEQIIVPGFTQKAVNDLLDFVYSGQLVCECSNFTEILSLIKLLDIQCDDCTEVTCVKHNSENSNVIDQFRLPPQEKPTPINALEQILPSGFEMVGETDKSVSYLFSLIEHLEDGKIVSQEEIENSNGPEIDNMSGSNREDCEFGGSDNEIGSVLNDEAVFDEEPPLSSVKRKRLYRNCKQSRRKVVSSNKHRASRIEKCRFCNKYLSFRSMRYHETMIHGIVKENRFECEKCGEKFSKSLDMRRHSMLHTYGRIVFPCKYCHHVFDERFRLNCHVQRVHRSQLCKYCCKPLPKVAKKHYQVCSERRRILHITELNEETTTSRTMRSSVSSSHAICNSGVSSRQSAALKIQTFKCKKCDKILKDIFALREHELSLHDILPWACSKCGSSFVKHRELQHHMAAHNPGNLPYKCKYCDQCFENVNARFKHYYHDHKDTMVHCTQCNEFIPIPLYRKHNLMHRTFQCDICGRSFPTDTGMNNHKLTHLDKSQWEFKCKECSAVFKRKDVLELHIMNKHTDPSLMPYRCSHCPSGFAHKSRLLVHLKKHK